MIAFLVLGLLVSTQAVGSVSAKGKGEWNQNHPRFAQMKEKMQSKFPHFRRYARSGKVIAISSEKLTLEGKNRPLTVEITLDTNTKYLNKNNDPISLSDIKVGDEVKVGGVRWDKDGKIFGPAKVVKTLNK